MDRTERETRPGTTKHVRSDLMRSRANLQHLIYSIEHDQSLRAECTRIVALKQLLQGIEAQIGTQRPTH